MDERIIVNPPAVSNEYDEMSDDDITAQELTNQELQGVPLQVKNFTCSVKGVDLKPHSQCLVDALFDLEGTDDLFADVDAPCITPGVTSTKKVLINNTNISAGISTACNVAMNTMLPQRGNSTIDVLVYATQFGRCAPAILRQAECNVRLHFHSKGKNPHLVRYAQQLNKHAHKNLVAGGARVVYNLNDKYDMIVIPHNVHRIGSNPIMNNENEVIGYGPKGEGIESLKRNLKPNGVIVGSYFYANVAHLHSDILGYTYVDEIPGGVKTRMADDPYVDPYYVPYCMGGRPDSAGCVDGIAIDTPMRPFLLKAPFANFVPPRQRAAVVLNNNSLYRLLIYQNKKMYYPIMHATYSYPIGMTHKFLANNKPLKREKFFTSGFFVHNMECPITMSKSELATYFAASNYVISHKLDGSPFMLAVTGKGSELYDVENDLHYDVTDEFGKIEASYELFYQLEYVKRTNTFHMRQLNSVIHYGRRLPMTFWDRQKTMGKICDEIYRPAREFSEMRLKIGTQDIEGIMFSACDTCHNVIERQAFDKHGTKVGVTYDRMGSQKYYKPNPTVDIPNIDGTTVEFSIRDKKVLRVRPNKSPNDSSRLIAISEMATASDIALVSMHMPNPDGPTPYYFEEVPGIDKENAAQMDKAFGDFYPHLKEPTVEDLAKVMDHKYLKAIAPPNQLLTEQGFRIVDCIGNLKECAYVESDDDEDTVI